ncbi:MAG: hypothetical protein JWN34_496, partial [Bryobacterales bacterium]|nr:hypothetical protein [Bryobacterales bacterium]
RFHHPARAERLLVSEADLRANGGRKQFTDGPARHLVLETAENVERRGIADQEPAIQILIAMASGEWSRMARSSSSPCARRKLAARSASSQSEGSLTTELFGSRCE